MLRCSRYWDHCSAVGIAILMGKGINSHMFETQLDGEIELGRAIPETRLEWLNWPLESE